MPDDPKQTRAPPASLRGTLIAVCVLYVLDAFVLAQGVSSTLIAMVAVVILMGRSVMAKKGTRSRIAPKLAVWFALPVVTIGTIVANNVLARHRAEQVILAVNAYKAKHGEFPKELEDLVPEILPSVPRAKYALCAAEFYYSNHEGNAWMLYTKFPPFGRPTYDFVRQRWGYID